MTPLYGLDSRHNECLVNVGLRVHKARPYVPTAGSLSITNCHHPWHGVTIFAGPWSFSRVLRSIAHHKYGRRTECSSNCRTLSQHSTLFCNCYFVTCSCWHAVSQHRHSRHSRISSSMCFMTSTRLQCIHHIQYHMDQHGVTVCTSLGITIGLEQVLQPEIFKTQDHHHL